MNSLAKLLASTATLITALSFAWIALTITGIVPYRIARFKQSWMELGWVSASILRCQRSGSIRNLEHFSSREVFVNMDKKFI